MAENIHIGRKVARLRELRGIKQEILAESLGISQQAVSKLEQSESIEETTLARIAKALNITPDLIKNFNEESVITNIQNIYDNATGTNSNNYNCTFNPLDEYRNEVKENKKLYEALLKEKDEKIALLNKLLNTK
ncbi:MAG TPA: helix-turn-helix domain-containing protein [Ohtaekwangia sp.]|uniref:helix-turn-helix domain-containing protein n=1 Tax=Ohtaekwangia sp. TaxID=2066019 RepID=UPI002F95525B